MLSKTTKFSALTNNLSNVCKAEQNCRVKSPRDPVHGGSKLERTSKVSIFLNDHFELRDFAESRCEGNTKIKKVILAFLAKTQLFVYIFQKFLCMT